MPEQLLEELKTIFVALAIRSPSSFSLGGQTFVVEDQPWPGSVAGPQTALSPLVVRLAAILYEHCYCRRFTGALEESFPWPDADEDLVPALSRANTSRERWEPGWQIEALLPAGQVIARKQERTKLLWPGEYLTPGEAGVSPRQGAAVTLYRPRESLTLQLGFYYLFGETTAELSNDYAVLRFYWNVRPTGAALLVRLLTQRLNRFQVPFQFKCLARAGSYNRRDTAVLFTQRRFHRIAAELLGDLHAQVRPHLEADTPLFTRRLAPGLALAEDPGTGESLGATRCRLVAQALEDAYQQESQTVDARLEALVRRFHQAGLTLERPHARSGHGYDYDSITLDHTATNEPGRQVP